MKKKDLIFYAGTAVLLAFSTQQVKADEQHASDQTPENTSAIVATTTSSEAQNTVSEEVGVEKGIQTENTVATEAAPVTPTLSNNQSSDKGTSDKVVSEQPAPAVVASRAPYGARARVVAARNESVPQQESPVSADLTIAKSESDGTFTITAKNLQGLDGYEEVKIPFWSHANGMKDIIWYTPTHQVDGSYTVTAKASDHENADGQYEAQVFYVDAKGQNKFVKKAFIDFKNQSRPTASLLIQNNNKDAGTFDVIIKDVYSPKGVQTVQVPTWSDKDGQDDIRWYEATRQANGDYKVSVKASDHKNSTGKYHVHLYYIQNDGSRIGIGTTTTDVEVRNAMTKTQASIKNVNATNGTYTVAVDQAPQGRQIKNIRVAAWSKAHQENLYWYSATPTGMHTEITVSANNHGNEAGNYTTHVYVDYKDGGVEGFNLGQTALSPRNQKVNPQTTYYSQRDPRWAGKYYGVSNVDQSGCVPTSLAMTFTDILGRTILPTTVADYLYNNTDSFNKGEAGTDSDGIVAATRNWGLKSQLINGAGGIAEALMAGKHVLAAVGNSQFTSDPYTHELVLHGYDNGRTYVRDPYNSGNNGWYSIDYLHSIKSKDPMDNKLGAPFFSIFA